MTITIKPMGGLGNQLFQYGLGKALARMHSVPLRVDLSHFGVGGLRGYELDSFDSTIEVSGIRSTERLVVKAVSALELLRPVALRKEHPLFLGVARETEGVFNPRFLSLPQRTTLRGYFQSWRYLDSVAEELRSELRAINRPTPWFLDTRQRLQDAGAFTALHVRLGDYLADPNFGHLTETYFSDALDETWRSNEGLPLVVFSDEIERAKTLSFLRRLSSRQVIFIDAPAESRPLESVVLMSLSDSLVMSNSTFSWWGAWLGDRPGRKVVAPTPWLLERPVDEENLFLDSWIRLPTAKSQAPPTPQTLEG